MKAHYFDERGLYYRTNEFTRDRPTLVFIHGLSGSSSAWKPYEEAFAHKYNLLTYDLRGHGKSLKQKNYSEYAMHKFVADLHALTLHLKLKKFILISHSFATLIALEWVAKHQGGVAAAVFLSSSFAPMRSRAARFMATLLPLTRIFDLLPLGRKTAKHIDYKKYPNTGDWNLRRMLADIPNTSLRVYLYCTRQSFTVDQEALLPHIRIPVLIMHGKKDTIFPVTNSLIMKEKIKHSTLILIDNADHIIVLNNVKEVTEAIEQFVEKIQELPLDF